MASIGSGGRKFTKLMTNHIFCDINRDKFFPVMHGKRMSNKIRHYRRTPGPRFQHLLLPVHIHVLDFFKQLLVNVRSFFYRSGHVVLKLETGNWKLSLLLQVSNFKFRFHTLFASLNNIFTRRVTFLPGFKPFGRLSPRTARMPTARCFGLASAHRMINRVHRNAAHSRPTS
jgi:hypothetical protein